MLFVTTILSALLVAGILGIIIIRCKGDTTTEYGSAFDGDSNRVLRAKADREWIRYHREDKAGNLGQADVHLREYDKLQKELDRREEERLTRIINKN